MILQDKNNLIKIISLYSVLYVLYVLINTCTSKTFAICQTVF